MYHYQFGGKNGQKLQLVEAKDLVVVRTKEPIELNKIKLSATSRSLLPKMLPVASFPESNVTVYKCIDKKCQKCNAFAESGTS